MVAALKLGLPDDYAREIQGIASAAGTTYDDAVLAQMYYELDRIDGSGSEGIFDRMCTSIVAQQANGTMYLAHNFDYPDFFTPGLLNARFIKDGKVLFEGTTDAGTVGSITGVAPGSHAVTIDARVGSQFTLSLPDAVEAAQNGSFVFVHLVRRAFEAGSYDAAIELLQEKPGMISPGYFIVGGSKPGQGAVITGNSSAVNNDVWRMKDADGWYIVETNYDHWIKGPSLRRDVARMGIAAIGADNLSLLGLWNVLSTFPVYAPNTITTHLVDIATGEHRAYHRHTEGGFTLAV